MLENIYKAVVELSSLSLFFIMLYWLRRAIGSIPLYILLGTFFAFAQIAQMPGFDKLVIDGSNVGMLANGILLIPVIQMYLTIYEEEGTLEAHRFIISMLISVVGCVYITQMILVHCEVGVSFSEMMGFLAEPKSFLYPMLIMTTTHLLMFMLIPVSYQTMRNMHIPVGVSMLMHIYAFVCGNNAMLNACGFSTQRIFPILEWNIVIILISFISHIYLKVTCGFAYIVKPPFAILSSLLEHIQSAGRLRQIVEEWAGRYQAVFDNTAELIFLVDSHGYVLNANHSAVRMLRNDLYAEGFYLVSIIHDEDGKNFDWDRVWEVLHQQKSSAEHAVNAVFHSMQLAFPDGRTAFVDFNISLAKQNDMEMAVIIMNDITAYRNEEQNRRKLEEQLIQSQKMEAVGVLAGGIAHDFNNLLMGIQASSEVMKQQNLNEKCRAMLANIENATLRAVDLVSKLLGFARKGKYQVKSTNLCTIAQKTAELFTVGLKDVQFKLLLYPEPLMIMADETQLQQAIMNLLINARDALTQEGRRKITLRTDMAHGDTICWQERPAAIPDEPEKYVTLCIKDTGQGMDEETKKRVFEPFYSTKGGNGTGLGMSMVYGCVMHHNGWLHISSEEGAGCEITVFIPGTNSNITNRQE